MTGAAHGVSKTEAFDRWFRYPAGFSREALEAALTGASCAPGTTCVDPFAGSASAGTFAVDNGLRFVGIEAHPLIAELAHLKFMRPGDPSGLHRAATRVAAQVSDPTRSQNEADLVNRCFDDDVLTKLLTLRDGVEALGAQDPWYLHAKWAVVGTLRDVASVKVGWPYQRPALRRRATYTDPVARFRSRAEMMAADLSAAPDPGHSRVIAGDSRQLRAWNRALEGDVASGSISSPPYLNNFDYADATRLEVFFLGQARSWKELCERVRAPMLVATTQQTRNSIADSAEAALTAFPETAAAVGRLTAALSAERRRRGRGKEYDKVIGPYFLGIAQVLACLYESLAPGSRRAWVIGDSAPYGIMVDTPALVLSLAQELGFDAVSDDVMRARGQRWRTNGTRHQVQLTERLVVFRRPPQDLTLGSVHE